MLHVISLGAGVQSSTMALMFAHGELTPMPDYAIFADTQEEPESVYRWLDWLEKKLPFPVLRRTAGNLREESLRLRISGKTGNKYLRSLVPAFYATKNGKGLFGRRCTADFKVAVLSREKRILAGIFGKQCSDVVVQSYIGISYDELHRMKHSGNEWEQNNWPLVDARITRQACKEWMLENGYPIPPRSACKFCPFHSDEEWMRLKTEEPDDWDKAVEFDRRLREMARLQTGTAKTYGDIYLHHSLVPLDEAKLGDADLQLDMFGNECEGLCGI